MLSGEWVNLATKSAADMKTGRVQTYSVFCDQYTHLSGVTQWKILSISLPQLWAEAWVNDLATLAFKVNL